MKTVKFKVSQPLPSYLVAFAVGRFDVVDAGKVGQTPLRVIVPRGKAGEAVYAATAIPQLLQLLENYFGIPYPYEKLDSVVMPISNFAMENAGMITYEENVLLANPQRDTINRQRDWLPHRAHEMAHQWFGDLVTTAWWNDIWLNEAFATWMERKITADWKPEWQMVLPMFNSAGRDAGQSDLRTQIRQPILSNDDIANAFDDITYEKGAAVIGMFESWIGPEKFRQGVRLYLKQHAEGTATAADFEAAISTVAGRDIAPEMDSFLDQAGAPEISVALDCASTPKLELSQKRVLPIGSLGTEGETWKIPVCVAYVSDGAPHRECQVLFDTQAEMALAGKTCPARLLANAGETGYYLVKYKGDLLQQLLADHGRYIGVAERVGVLGDVQALVSNGDYLPATALGFDPGILSDPNWEVVEASADTAGLLKGEDVPDDLRSKAAQFVVRIFGQRAAALGWTAQPGDSDDTRLLRQKLVPFVASVGGKGSDRPSGKTRAELAQDAQRDQPRDDALRVGSGGRVRQSRSLRSSPVGGDWRARSPRSRKSAGRARIVPQRGTGASLARPATFQQVRRAGSLLSPFIWTFGLPRDAGCSLCFCA